MNTQQKTRWLTVNAMGVALFVVLSLCLQVPIFSNYYICLGYLVMAIFCYSLGSASGAIVGALGTILYCMAINGLRGMPGWTLGNIVIALILGVVFKKCSEKEVLGKADYFIMLVAILFATALGILGVKSFTEVVLYAQPFWFRVTTNVYAFIADVVTLWLSIPLCIKLRPQISRIVNT